MWFALLLHAPDDSESGEIYTSWNLLFRTFMLIEAQVHYMGRVKVVNKEKIVSSAAGVQNLHINLFRIPLLFTLQFDTSIFLANNSSKSSTISMTTELFYIIRTSTRFPHGKSLADANLSYSYPTTAPLTRLWWACMELGSSVSSASKKLLRRRTRVLPGRIGLSFHKYPRLPWRSYCVQSLHLACARYSLNTVHHVLEDGSFQMET